jgi:hypothetical protein
MRRVTLAVLAVLMSTSFAAAAVWVSEVEFRKAAIQMDAGKRELMRDIETLVTCLESWNPGDGRQYNKVEIKRTGRERFTISTALRSPTNMYFEVTHEYGAPVAVLRRVEYLFPERHAFQQITDAETKRAALHSACPSL